LTQCTESHFDVAQFDQAHFAGGLCNTAGVFDLSRFNSRADEHSPATSVADSLTRFAPLADDEPVTLGATWPSHDAGAFVVNLPADLPPQFGARFNVARFGSRDTKNESYPEVVFDPPADPQYIEKVLPQAGGGSALVYAQAVPFVPLGWEAQSVPFFQPRTRNLTGGRAGQAAALYLQERDVPGAFAIFARSEGTWGNDISISVRYSGPAIFSITVAYVPARFECARAIAFSGRVLQAGEPAFPNLTGGTIATGPVGILQAKAAGIHAAVTRERTRAQGASP
jgi:hypothetical protein